MDGWMDIWLDRWMDGWMEEDCMEIRLADLLTCLMVFRK